MLKPLLCVSAVVLLGISALVVPGPSAQESKKGVSQVKAKEIWTRDCAFCHGATGDGKSDMAKDFPSGDLTDAKTLAGKSDQEIYDIIRKGKGKMFPEDASRAKDDEVKALVTFVKNLPNQEAAPAAAPAEAAPAAEAPKSN
jgi:mono/diheme cytochrome c family protein